MSGSPQLKPFVSKDFSVPMCLRHSRFVLRPRLITDVVQDYAAVMTSVHELRGIFGSSSNWPPADLSFEQDLIDLGWHHKEFQRRTSFAYTMLSPDEDDCWGCVYIYPTTLAGFDAEAYCWVRTSHAALLDGALFAALKEWLTHSWPFQRVAFPGRELTGTAMDGDCNANQ
jgi:hypothetical protein